MVRDTDFDSYAQQTPYQDTPNHARPSAQSPLQSAVSSTPTTTPGAPAYPVDPGMAQWRTGGYSAPQYTTPGFAQNAMAGWDQSKWNDPTRQSPKYAVGRILSQFDPNGAAQNGTIQRAFAEIQRAYPGSTFNGKDTVTIPGVGEVDLLEAAGLGGKAWQWGAKTAGQPNGQATTATGGISPLQVAITQQQGTNDAGKSLLDSLMRNY